MTHLLSIWMCLSNHRNCEAIKDGKEGSEGGLVWRWR